MKRYCILILLTAFSVLSFTGKPIHSQVQRQTTFPKFKVHVDIHCEDKNTKASIESHIKRELRSLQDVQIEAGSKDAGYGLMIIALEGKYEQTGQKSGSMSIAYMFLQKFRMRMYKGLITNAGWEVLKSFENELYFPPILGVGNYNTDTIYKVGKDIVVRFDTQILEPIRKINSQFSN